MAYIRILSLYFLVLMISFFITLIILFVFLESNKHSLLIMISLILFIILSTIYIYMIQHVFKLFNGFLLSNLGIIVLAIGSFVSFIIDKIYKHNEYFLFGVVISIVSASIVGILSITFL